MEVQFVASFAPIVRDAEVARAFYGDALGLSFEGSEGEYVFTQKLDGTKHFGLWPLSEAATACFGITEWPSEIPVPQASIEFEVADVAAAAKELEARLPADPRRPTEPWAQITPAVEPRGTPSRGLLHPVVPRRLQRKHLTTPAGYEWRRQARWASSTGKRLVSAAYQRIEDEVDLCSARVKVPLGPPQTPAKDRTMVSLAQ